MPIVSSSGVCGCHDDLRVWGPGIVTGRYGTIGEVYWIEKHFWPLNTALFVKDYCGNDRRYLYYLLSNLNIRKYSGKTGVPGVNRNDLHNISVLVPPFKEQVKIARVLWTWDLAIQTMEKLIEIDASRKKAWRQQLLTGKKRFNGFSGDVKQVRIRDVADVDSRSLGKDTSGSFEFRYISLSNVKPGCISDDLAVHRFRDSPTRARRVLREGDVLVPKVRPNLQSFSRVGRNHSSCIASTAFAILSPREGCDGRYLYHYLFSAHMAAQIHGLVAGSNYPAIHSADVKGLAIHCPELEEQKMISGMLNNTETMIDNLTEQLRILKMQRKALMQQLLTGKRRVVRSARLLN